MLNTKDDKVLNIETIKRIILYKSVEKKYRNIKSYFYKVGSTTSKVYVNIKNQYKQNINSIVNDIEQLFTQDIILNNQKVIVLRETPVNPFYNFVLVLKHNNNTTKILFPVLQNKIVSTKKTSQVLLPGVANELMFVSIIKDQVNFLDESVKDLRTIFPSDFNPKVSLFVYEKLSSVVKAKIGPIRSVAQVGQQTIGGLQQKPDVKISTPSGMINISLKQNNFPAWSSAMTYVGGKNILENLVNTNQIQVISKNGRKIILANNAQYSGIVIPATVGEVKKYCFNDNEVKYIIINNFSTSDVISQMTKFDESLNNYKVDLTVNIIYENIQSDIDKLSKNVFLCIQSSTRNSSILTPKYSGMSINFIPEHKIESDFLRLPQILSISGRL